MSERDSPISSIPTSAPADDQTQRAKTMTELIRYFLAKGDQADSATIIEGLDSAFCSNPPPTVELATLEMRTYCSACEREGFIAPRGPRWFGTAQNGKGWALSGDVNVCGCVPAPIFRAKRGMTMSFTADELAALIAGDPSLNVALEPRDNEDLERYFEIVDAKTGAPVDRMVYNLSRLGECIVSDERLANGTTRSVPESDSSDLSFVAWTEGNVR